MKLEPFDRLDRCLGTCWDVQRALVFVICFDATYPDMRTAAKIADQSARIFASYYREEQMIRSAP